MKNPDKWKPTKFIIKDGKMGANSKFTGAGSRLMAELIAQRYSELLPKYCAGKLLDLGCGNVPMYNFYKSLASSITCADWENTLHPNNFTDLNVDLSQEIPLPKDTFDTIILSDVLEHLKNPSLALSEINRLLKSQGYLIMNVPFYYRLHETPYDFYRYTRFALLDLIEGSNLKLIELRELGGSPEIISDILSKHTERIPSIGNFLATTIYYFTRCFLSLKLGRRLSKRSSEYFPFGYSLVAQK